MSKKEILQASEEGFSDAANNANAGVGSGASRKLSFYATQHPIEAVKSAGYFNNQAKYMASGNVLIISAGVGTKKMACLIAAVSVQDGVVKLCEAGKTVADAPSKAKKEAAAPAPKGSGAKPKTAKKTQKKPPISQGNAASETTSDDSDDDDGDDGQSGGEAAGKIDPRLAT